MNYREKIREQINKYPYGEYYGLKPNQPKDIIRLLNEMDRADEYIKTLYFKNENLQSKIDKAIEYINKHCVNEKISKEVGYKCYTMADTNELEKIMNILGDDK